MNNNAKNLEKLTYAVTSLNDDALGMHELIQKGTSDLERTIAIQQKSSEEFEENSKAIRKIINTIPARLESIDDATENVRVNTAASLEATVEQIRTIRDDGQKTFAKMIDSLEQKHAALETSLRFFEEQSLEETQRSRIDIQTDIRNHRAAISNRTDDLKNEITELKTLMHGFDEEIMRIKDGMKASTRPILIIGIGVLLLEIASIAISILALLS